MDVLEMSILSTRLTITNLEKKRGVCFMTMGVKHLLLEVVAINFFGMRLIPRQEMVSLVMGVVSQIFLQPTYTKPKKIWAYHKICH
jgi:stress-induced morphogen